LPKKKKTSQMVSFDTMVKIGILRDTQNSLVTLGLTNNFLFSSFRDYIAQASLHLTIFLPHLPKCWVCPQRIRTFRTYLWCFPPTLIISEGKELVYGNEEGKNEKMSK
jgi:hypothetical protein